MSGVGKTTIGEILSKDLNRKFVDMDHFIINKMDMEIEDIFSLYGESYFRKLESNVAKDISDYENTIISTGGGIVLNSKNIINLKKRGIIVFLEASIDTITNNLRSSTTIRPLLSDSENLDGNTKKLYDSRKKLYLSSADFIISVDNKSIRKIAYEVLEKCVKINS